MMYAIVYRYRIYEAYCMIPGKTYGQFRGHKSYDEVIKYDNFDEAYECSFTSGVIIPFAKYKHLLDLTRHPVNLLAFVPDANTKWKHNRPKVLHLLETPIKGLVAISLKTEKIFDKLNLHVLYDLLRVSVHDLMVNGVSQMTIDSLTIELSHQQAGFRVDPIRSK